MGETCDEAQYVSLTKDLKKEGYIVVSINPDWKKPLTKQLVKIERDSIIFGFSMGAVLAYLIAKKYPCKKAIMASISPIHTFIYKDFKEFLNERMTPEESGAVTNDILAINVDLENLKTPHVTLMGEKEEMAKGEKSPDIFVAGATHEIGEAYRLAILKQV